MPKKPTTQKQLLAENADLRARLEKADATLREILSGEADALFVSGVGGEQIFTLKGADQSYRILVEDMSEGALTMTVDGVILYANRRFAEMLKMPLEKVIGTTIHTWIAPDSQHILQSLLSKSAGEKRREQLGLTASDGTRMPIYLSLSNLPVNEISDSYCLVATDLTEQIHNEAIVASEKSVRGSLEAANQSRRELLSVVEDQKQAEESLRQLNEELENKVASRTADLEQSRHDAEAANQAKSAFLSAMSHEIRTPMNGVVGMIDVLQQSSLNGSQMEMANIIHDSAFALLAIIDDILDFSKIEAGKLQIDNVPMSIADVVEGTCEAMSRMALTKGVELTLFTDPAIPAAVMGDPGRLRQILVNLVNNAIKFSSKQTRQGKVSARAVLVEDGSHLTVRPELDITVRSDPSAALRTKGVVEPHSPSTGSGRTDGGDLRTAGGGLKQVTLELHVADNGIGIDKATQARLFSSFTQADSSTTRTYGGTGLGLVISRQLANIMGGEITVQSELGEGSLFSMRLPFAINSPLPSPPPQAEEGVALSPVHGGRLGWGKDIVAGLSCLVVGGAESLADDLATYLAYDKAVTERAMDIAAAQQWIASRPPGLYVVVIDTEGINQLLDELRAAARTRPNLDVRFVAIERGGRQHCRSVAADLVALDAEVMHHRAFMEAVAIAAGRAKQPDREDASGNAKAAPALPSREEARQQGRLILIAEDNEINQKVLLQQLKLLGQIADIASNGREALELWQSGDYSFLFTDLHMPEMDGYQLTAAIRAAEKIGASETHMTRITIIAITANAIKGEADHCRAIGMDDYLSKPVQLVNLKAMLEKWLPVVTPDSIPDEATSTQTIDINTVRAELVEACPEPDETTNMTTSHLTNPAKDAGQVIGYSHSTRLPKDGNQVVGYVEAAHSPFDKFRANGLQISIPAHPTGGSPMIVDVNVLKALIGDDEAMIREFLHDFRTSAAKIAVELRTACAAGQAAAVSAAAHKLKSSSRSVGALALGELCAEMENADKAGDMAALMVLLPRFEQELACVEHFLEGY